MQSLYGSITNLFAKSSSSSPSSSNKTDSLSSRDSLHPDDAANVTLDDNGVVARVFLEGIHEVQYKSIVVSVTHDAYFRRFPKTLFSDLLTRLWKSLLDL